MTSGPMEPVVESGPMETSRPNIGPWDDEPRCARRRCRHPQSWHHLPGCDEETCPCPGFVDPAAQGGSHGPHCANCGTEMALDGSCACSGPITHGLGSDLGAAIEGELVDRHAARLLMAICDQAPTWTERVGDVPEAQVVSVSDAARIAARYVVARSVPSRSVVCPAARVDEPDPIAPWEHEFEPMAGGDEFSNHCVRCSRHLADHETANPLVAEVKRLRAGREIEQTMIRNFPAALAEVERERDELRAANGHNEWACEGNQRLYHAEKERADAAEARLAAVRKLHERGTISAPVFDEFDQPWRTGCTTCGESWPCRTVRALDAEVTDR